MTDESEKRMAMTNCPSKHPFPAVRTTMGKGEKNKNKTKTDTIHM
jgi:hypothetical protein